MTYEEKPGKRQDRPGLISRQEAMARGLKRYFTGIVCNNGHIAERLTCDWRCVVCKQEKHHRWQRTHRDHVNLRNRQWAAANRKQQTERIRIWRRNNREKYRETVSSYNKKYISTRRGLAKHAEKARRRKATMMRATPAWADIKEMQSFYENCPAGHEVDHIIPIQNPLICGLHVLENLQYLPISENRSKGSRMRAQDHAAISAPNAL